MGTDSMAAQDSVVFLAPSCSFSWCFGSLASSVTGAVGRELFGGTIRSAIEGSGLLGEDVPGYRDIVTVRVANVIARAEMPLFEVHGMNFGPTRAIDDPRNEPIARRALTSTILASRLVWKDTV